MAKTLKRDPNRCPTHPGALLREDIMPAVRRNVKELAALLGISRQHLSDIVNEHKPVTAHVAVLLGTLLQMDAELWLRMQAAYDAWHAKRETDVSHIKPLRKAA